MMEVKMQEPRAQPDKEPVDPVAEKAAVYAAKEKQKMEAPEDKGARTAGGKRKNASCRSYFEPEHPVRKAGKLFAGPGEKRNTRKPDLVRNLRKTAAEAGRTIDSETGGDSGSLEESTVQEGAALAFEGAGIFSSLERNERLQEKNSRFVKENTEPEETKGSDPLPYGSREEVIDAEDRQEAGDSEKDHSVYPEGMTREKQWQAETLAEENQGWEQENRRVRQRESVIERLEEKKREIRDLKPLPREVSEKTWESPPAITELEKKNTGS
jgi:hypothetical protein